MGRALSQMKFSVLKKSFLFQSRPSYLKLVGCQIGRMSQSCWATGTKSTKSLMLTAETLHRL